MRLTKLCNIVAGIILASLSLVMFQGCSSTNGTMHEFGSYGSGSFFKNKDTYLNSELYSLEKVAPQMVNMGEDFDYMLKLCPKVHLMNVTLYDMLPSGMTYVSSEPEGVMQDGKLMWNFDRLGPSEMKTVMIHMKAEESGTFKNCAYVTATPLVCTKTLVGEPMLSVCKTGPESAKLGECIVFKVVLKNEGTYPAKNVIIQDLVPDGLMHASGQSSVSIDAGTVNPGETRSYNFTFTATQRGTLCNVVKAMSNGTMMSKTEACVNVMEPGIIIRKDGPATHSVGDPAKYTLLVQNSGNMPLYDVQVMDDYPIETELVEFTPGGDTAEPNKVTWHIDRLDPGQTMEYMISLCANAPGNYCNCMGAYVPSEDMYERYESCTEWVGRPGLLTTMVDSKDPLLAVKEEKTTYTITVKNQGTASDKNIRVMVEFPDEIEPTGVASGPTAHSITDNTVTFEPVKTLDPQRYIKFKVEGKAVQRGDARVVCKLTSDTLDEPLKWTESTQVY